jgi:NadR type nicotinamide-nucleotide adenylyltransferase
MTQPPLRIVLTGAESSGKSTLTVALAEHLQVPFALEYARLYLEKNGPRYDYASVHTIAREHLVYQKNQVPCDSPIALYDTDLINFKIWCEVAFGSCEPWLTQAIQAEPHHAYLLCYPDLPWQNDPLREYPSPESRLWLFEKHQAFVQATGRPYAVIKGSGQAREQAALQAVQQLLHPVT